MNKYLVLVAGLMISTSIFAREDFKSDDFLKVLRSKRDILKDYALKPYVVGGIKYQATYVSSEGEGFYLEVRNEVLAAQEAKAGKERKDGKGPTPSDYHELWGPYKTRDEANAAKEAIPKDSIYSVVFISERLGAYSTKWYTLQESLHKDDDRSLTDCYVQQVKEFEKAKADESLGGFIGYLGLEVVKIQILDLRKGVPRENPARDLFGFGDFTVSATLDADRNCKITTVSDMRELFKPHIEHHQKLVTANLADMNAEKRKSRGKILSEFQERLKLNVDRIRNPANFIVEPLKPPPATKKTNTKT